MTGKKTQMGVKISRRLHAELSRRALQSGQSKQGVLEHALRLYFQAMDASQFTVRQEVLEHFRESVSKNARLIRHLGGQEPEK